MDNKKTNSVSIGNTDTVQNKNNETAETTKSNKGKVVLAIGCGIIVLCIICIGIIFGVTNYVANKAKNLTNTYKGFANQYETQIKKELKKNKYSNSTNSSNKKNNIKNSISKQPNVDRPTDATAADFTVFVDKNLYIEYPNDWTLDTPSTLTPNSSVIFQTFSYAQANDIFKENLNITKEDISTNKKITLAKYVEISITNLEKTYPSMNIINSFGTTIAGSKAFEIQYTVSYGDVGLTGTGSVKLMQILTIIKDKAYVLTYAGLPEDYNTYINDVNYMINSLKIY